MQFQWHPKKFFGSVSGSRIFFDYSKRPNLSFPRALKNSFIGMNLCILVDYTRKKPKICCINVVKKSFLCRFQILEFISTTWNDRNFLFPRALRKSFIDINLCVLVDYTRKQPKIAVWMSSKKVFWIGLRFSNFFQLLETTEIFFYLGVLERASSA